MSHQMNLSTCVSEGCKKIWWKIPFMSTLTVGKCWQNLSRTQSRGSPRGGQGSRSLFSVCLRYWKERLKMTLSFQCKLEKGKVVNPIIVEHWQIGSGNLTGRLGPGGAWSSHLPDPVRQDLGAPGHNWPWRVPQRLFLEVVSLATVAYVGGRPLVE